MSKKGFYKRPNYYKVKGPTEPYKIFKDHHDDKESPILLGDEIIVTAIDPGYVNCGFYSMSYNIKTGKRKTICLDRLTFEAGNERTDSIKQFDSLERYGKYFSKSHYILVEEQMTQSIRNTRMGQHIQTYFITRYRNIGYRPVVVEISNQTKTKVLNAPKGLPPKGKVSIKTWCHEKAIEFLEKRNSEHEEWFLKKLKNWKKADDMGDAICYAELWYLILNSEVYHPPKPKRPNIEIEEDEEV